jgi:hypothetical protein
MTTLIITFSILAVFVVGFWSAVAFYTLSITAVEPPHAVSDNEPEDDYDWEYIQRVPAYIRRQTEKDRKVVEDDWTWSNVSNAEDVYGGSNPHG